MAEWEHVEEADGDCSIRRTEGDSVRVKACPFHQEVTPSSLLAIQPYIPYWPEDDDHEDEEATLVSYGRAERMELKDLEADGDSDSTTE